MSRCVWLLILCLLGFGFAWANPVWGHRRTPRVWCPNQSQHEERQTRQPLGLTSGPPPCTSALSPKPGQACPFRFIDLLNKINAYPHEGRRPAVLLDLASQAETQGFVDLAKKVYTLAASLYPDTPFAKQARLKRLILEFYLDLGTVDPFQAFKTFLANLSKLSPDLPSEDLYEPLAAGWQAVERTLGNQVPGSFNALEKAIGLWELHPPEFRPAYGALVLGRLFKDHGLLEGAGVFLSKACDQGAGTVRLRALIELLQLAWQAEGLHGFLKTLALRGRSLPELILALRTWPLQLGSPQGGEPDGPGETPEGFQGLLKDASSLPVPGDSSITLNAQLWEALLTQPLPAPLKDYFLQSAARRAWQSEAFREAGKLYQDLLTRVADKETSLFFWDRLGLVHLRTRQPEIARDIFQTLEKEPGRFWQLVARTRQLDLELNRLMTEPAS